MPLPPPYKEVPYKGEPEPKFPKPRRQFRNLRKEMWENMITILVIVILCSLFFAFLALDPTMNNVYKSSAAIIAIPFILIFVTGVAFGLKSINRFRKGIDIDTSKEEHNEHQDNQPTEEHHEDHRHKSHSHTDNDFQKDNKPT